MTNKLSVHIPTFNDVTSAKLIIDSLDKIADEFIIFDQSNQYNKNLLKKLSKVNKKIKIIDFIPLGYPELLRSFAIQNCKNNWVLLVDVGEKLSKEFIKKIPYYINKNNVDGFICRRIDKLSKGSYEIWQPRIFKKDKAVNLGFLHDLIGINGKTETLIDKNIFMIENIDYETNPEKLLRYFKIESYTSRLLYTDLLKISQKRSKLLFKSIKIYLKIFKKDEKTELSYFEYKIMNILYLLYLYISQKEKISFKGIKFKNWYNSKKFKFFSTTNISERKLQIEIKNEIDRYGGLIKYLSLDNALVITTLYNKLKDSKLKPEDNLINLLILRNRLGFNYFKLMKEDFNDIK